MTETRVVNESTGGEKGAKSCRMDLVPVRPLRELAEHFGRGAEKYEARNWEKGVDWSLNYAALLRHVTAWWDGEELDEEGAPHLAAVAWHAFALMEYAHTHPELDDRPATQTDKLALRDAVREAKRTVSSATERAMLNVNKVWSTSTVPDIRGKDA